jgi:predicted O-methyltransferase YrrM
MYRGRFGIIAAMRRALAGPPDPQAAPEPPPAPVAVEPPEPARPAEPAGDAAGDADADRETAVRRDLVLTGYRRILRREPDAAELETWTEAVRHIGPTALIERFFDSDEYLNRNRVGDRVEFACGHYYSPVVDPEGLKASGFRVDRTVDTLPGLDLRPAEQEAFWERRLAAMNAAPFPARETPGRRYYAENDVYAWGDALVLLAMFHEHRPKRVVEIGSGFSSACMLDICDDLGLATRFTFVEPYPDRLYSRLSEADRRRCEILPIPVQALPPEAYETLEPGDILFIDSTHVSKTGSDVNFELFEMLPRLQPGVVIHIHDCFWPFEYPDSWIFQARRSWNELYILRAFLMGNRDYEILFFNDYFAARHRRQAIRAPKFGINPGGGLWLRKRG